jgi:F-type H+-transporting ATPase subunit b
MKISPDITIVFQIVNFVVLIFLMNVIVYKPIRRIIAERKGVKDGLLHDIESSLADAGETARSLEAGIAKARAEGVAAKEALAAEASEKEKELLAQISSKAASELAVLKGRIEAEAASAKTALMAEINMFASAIGEKILGRTLQ